MSDLDFGRANAHDLAIDRGTSVEAASVVREDVVRTLALSGRVEPTGTVPLAAARSETVLEVRVDRGDRVSPGQVLARLDSGPMMARIEELRSRVAQASANLRLVQAGASPQRIAQARQEVGIADEALKRIATDLRENEALLAKGLVSRNSVEDPRTQQAQAAMRLEATRQALLDLEKPRPDDVRASAALLEAARRQLEAAEIDQEQLEVRAPFDAVVLERRIEPGERPPVGQALFILRTVEPLVVVANLDERYLADVEPGQAARVAVESAPRRSYPATVSRVDPYVDPLQGTARVELRFEKAPQGAVWRPGVTVIIDIRVAEHPAALTVPRAATRTPDPQTRVFVIRDGRAVDVPITVIPWRSERVVVLEGLSEGDQVITTPDRVHDGAAVRVTSR
jgi:HlyD family secretion protein